MSKYKQRVQNISKSRPLVSVVMPVYNAAEFLSEAIESILNQTYKRFEFIIVDDASTDDSFRILREYSKKNRRIKLLRNRVNRGVSKTVKKAIAHTRGDFIARMDADDIALPDRIEKQVNHLLSHKKTIAVGGQCILIDKKGLIIGKKTFPTKFQDIYKYIFEFVPVQQPTLMIIRKRLPKNFEFYRDGLNTAEEIELYFKLFLHGKVENLNEPVLMYRQHDKNTSLIDLRKTFLLTLVSRIKAILKYHYKPTFTGILVTFLQLLLVLILPKKATLLLYQIVRAVTTYQKAPSLPQIYTIPMRTLTTKF